MADHNAVLSSRPFATPMRRVKPPKSRIHDGVSNAPLVAALEERGVTWPLGGYAPGLYVQTCVTCGEQHTAAKRSVSCLPCVLALTVAEASDHSDRYDQGVAEGRRRATADVVRALGVEVRS